MGLLVDCTPSSTCCSDIKKCVAVMLCFCARGVFFFLQGLRGLVVDGRRVDLGNASSVPHINDMTERHS